MINQGQSPDMDTYSDILASERTARTYAELMKSESILQQSLQRLGSQVPVAELNAQITEINVLPVRDTQLIDLSVEGLNPELIAAVANVLPELFLDELRQMQSSRFADSKASLQEQLTAISRQVEATQLEMDGLEDARTAQEELEYGRLRNALTQYQASYANLLQTYEMLRLAEAQAMDNLVIVEAAEPPTTPAYPRTLLNVLLATIVGTGMAVGAILLLDILDDRIRTPEDVKRMTTLPVLGMISHTSARDVGKDQQFELISAVNPRHPTVEAFRRLRTNLQYYNVDKRLRTLLITSAHPNAGKSVTAVNLALVLAQSGKNVVLVDTDLRRSRLHHIFGIARRPGLSEALTADIAVESLLMQVNANAPAPIPNLRVLVSGSKAPNPAELLGSQRMATLIETLKSNADVVVFDSPPLMAVADAQVISQTVDGTLLVVNSQKTSGGDLQHAIEMLEQVQAPLLGIVLNRYSRTGKGYHYYTYNYYTDEDAEEHSGGNPRNLKGRDLRAGERGEGAGVA